jgi:hypothetical protein
MVRMVWPTATAARFLPAHAADGQQVQRPVGVAVAAPVQPMALGLAGGSRDGRDAAQVGESALVAQAVGIVPGRRQQGGRDVDADALDRDQVRGGLATSTASCASSCSISALNC